MPTTVPQPLIQEDLEEMSVPPEILSSCLHVLSRLGLHVNLLYKLVICLKCSEALDHRHIQTHITWHGMACPPENELKAILQDLHLMGPPSLSPSDIVPPIVGLKLLNSFTCLAQFCGITIGSRTSLQCHREECHVSLAVSSEPCQVHRIYGFRSHQIVVRVDLSLAVVCPHGSLAEYLAIVHPKEDCSLLPLLPSDDPCKTTGFLHQSKWPQVVSGHSTQEILSLVANPKSGDTLFPVLHAIKTNFKWMWDEVDGMEVLPRRHIHTPKGNLDSPELENKPFGRSQTEEYLFRCANHWAMYICALLHSLDLSPPVFTLSPPQLEHCQLLNRALAENADLSDPVQSLSFSLMSTYTLDIQRDSSLCPLSHFITFWHLREDGTFQPPSSISPNLASLTYCF
ncbi:hypothetical protein J3R83DRAFT_7940 [Lanmaoa asiatica]|nr:hypothetical protein J3R83DRAFT_7940 [Lanmaoa asiatica]